MRFLVRASYLQIYNEQISDLLKPERNNLTIREDKKRGVFVEGLSEWVVRAHVVGAVWVFLKIGKTLLRRVMLKMVYCLARLYLPLSTSLLMLGGSVKYRRRPRLALDKYSEHSFTCWDGGLRLCFSDHVFARVPRRCRLPKGPNSWRDIRTNGKRWAAQGNWRYAHERHQQQEPRRFHHNR